MILNALVMKDQDINLSSAKFDDIFKLKEDTKSKKEMVKDAKKIIPEKKLVKEEKKNEVKKEMNTK